MKNVLLVGIILFAFNGCASKSVEPLEASNGVIQSDRIKSEGSYLGWILGVILVNVGGNKNVHNVSQVYKASAVGGVAGLASGVAVSNATQGYATKESELHKEEREYIEKTKVIKNKISTRNRNVTKTTNNYKFTDG